MQIASDMRMPMLKLFGTPATGLNASDESSIEVYNSMVESQVRDKIKYDILRILEIKCQKLFQFIPEDLSIEFEPLKVLSAEQQENVKNAKFTRLQAAADSSRITNFEYREACNKGNLFDITLDNSGDLLNPDDPDIGEIVEESGQGNKEDQDMDDPGSNREDTRKLRAWEPNGSPKGNVQKKPGRDNVHIENSTAFDKASYEADGGDSQLSAARLKLLKTLTPNNPALWEQCKQESAGNFRFAYWLFTKKKGKMT
jgi:hypothetical protein